MAAPKQYTLLSWNSSTITSGPVFVGDAWSLSVSLVTTTTGSAYTIQGSNDEGFASVITQWSTMTTLTAQGIFAVQPAVRWLRALQPTSTSSATLQLAKTLVT